jgi:hypothetical protein
MPSRKCSSAKEKAQQKGKKRKSADRCTSLSPKPKRVKPIAKSRQAAVMTEEEDTATVSYGAVSDAVTEEPIEVSEEETENESSETELGKYKLI